MKRQNELTERFKFLNLYVGMGQIACYSGWFNIIKKFCEDVEKEIEKQNLEDFKIIQIKEKFGMLRIYDTFSNKAIDDLITKAEEESARTCEVCGESGEMDNDGRWMKTLCEKHKKERKIDNLRQAWE